MDSNRSALPFVSEVRRDRVRIAWFADSPYLDVSLSTHEAQALADRINAVLYLDAIKDREEVASMTTDTEEFDAGFAEGRSVGYAAGYADGVDEVAVTELFVEKLRRLVNVLEPFTCRWDAALRRIEVQQLGVTWLI